MLSSKILDGNRATNQTALKRINFHIPFKKIREPSALFKGVEMEIDKKRYLTLSVNNRSKTVVDKAKSLSDKIFFYCHTVPVLADVNVHTVNGG